MNNSTCAHTDAIRLLIEVVVKLSTAGDGGQSFRTICGTEANDNEPISDLPVTDAMSLRDVLTELRLKEKQVVTLRRLWGFPSPRHSRGRLLFSRREVRSWVCRQPNQSNLAAVLRLRRRDHLSADD